MMDMNEIRDLLPAYALGAVEAWERAEIETALANSPELREELATYTPVLEALALSVPQMKPPADLGERILHKATVVVAMPRRFPVLPFLAVAAAVVIVLAGVLAIQLLSDDDDKLTESQQIAAIMDHPDSSHIELTGMDENVHGELVVDPEHSQAVLHLANLPAAPDKNYQLWFEQDGSMVSAAVFVPESATSDDPLLIDLPENFASYEGVGITLEPVGGSPAPTTDPVLLVAFNLSSEQ